jgi:hypothetical protein
MAITRLIVKMRASGSAERSSKEDSGDGKIEGERGGGDGRRERVATDQSDEG